MNSIPNFSHLVKPLTKNSVVRFQNVIWDYYRHNKRSFPWRETTNPYFIMVSEAMLQQTQTKRVGEYYRKFIDKFPTVESLATATLREILTVWQGLGYNRRAKFLHNAAQKVVADFDGLIPATLSDLEDLPGIGPNTAGAILAYAYNQPTAFIETNIRSVFLYLFFRNTDAVSDSELLSIIDQTLDKNNPRDWYYALTDYGVFIKSQTKNPSRKSKHYTKQSKFEGSDRQLRAKIISMILNNGPSAQKEFYALNQSKQRIDTILDELRSEKLIRKSGTTFSI
ncbi:endonuclease III [candidate division WWE3 bacterium CG_4_9_14_3_um_filter_41_6]|uniref:Adenine DNA glycosylase n=1 Tax=candidate division WWE3 bacterium CG_4_10_14_0_2_um_filter_41_14 TaxID=1975072 RepID=A0A2M7TII5_UNCKA|nr:MAG: endonuclease III [candidate division WWE3 bacterium CG_4_10_14_0_2_um_filter_41_14]PJA38258.1 MAG: endonuclease III [candidate division WWE3 bacterium CG_4_9_14_3_um_filter_41_6]